MSFPEMRTPLTTILGWADMLLRDCRANASTLPPKFTEAVETIKMFKPFPNSTCTHCHSTKLPGWTDTPDHRAMGDGVEVGCTSHGCHGPAHPFAGGSR